MAYYDALVAKWATLPNTNTIGQNLTLVNAATVAGPTVDVAMGDVVGFLALQGVLSSLEDYVASDPSPGAARTAAIELLRLTSTPSITQFKMSNPIVATAVGSFITALVAAGQMTGAQATGLAAMSATTVPWWQVNGYPSPFNEHDLVAAGIMTHQQAFDEGLLASPDPEFVGSNG